MGLQMIERPILFSGEMVRAIIDGRKTQTRRICKKEVQFDTNGDPFFFVPENAIDDESFGKWVGIDEYSPHGRVGDRLWVRENFRFLKSHDRQSPSSLSPISVVFYESDAVISIPCDAGRMRPSIHMPRWASRITLEITDIRVERLQDITECDAIAEGVERVNQCGILRCCGYKDHTGNRGGFMHAKKSFETLWDSINADRAPWSSNPWVWVIEFKRI